MRFNWRGNRRLSPLFIPFLALVGIILGEVIPACSNPGGCFVEPPNGKHSLFVDYLFIPITGVYLTLGVFFWFLYRRLNWVIVAVIATALGEAMEFVLFRPQENPGINVVDEPLRAFVSLLFVWPILLVAPYLAFVAIGRVRSAVARWVRE
jgi:hypothetical protein